MPNIRTHFCFAVSSALMVVLSWAPLSALAALCYGSPYYSYIFLIPLISGGLIVLARRRIFVQSTVAPRLGALLVSSGLLLFQIARWLPGLNSASRMSATTFCLVSTWIGLFLFFYGIRASRVALFPLLLMFFVIPPPDRVLAAANRSLQIGSALVSYRLIQALGVPVTREGMVLSLPGLDIEVAPECSGIRSSIALLILTLVAAYLYLRSSRYRLLLAIAVVPVVILKNAIRISTISLLAAYVDRGYLAGGLHHRGGALFFLLGAVLLVPVLVLLHRHEDRRQRGMQFAGGPGGERLES